MLAYSVAVGVLGFMIICITCYFGFPTNYTRGWSRKSEGVYYRARGACAEHDMGGERPNQPGYRAFLRKIYMRRKSAGGAWLEAKSRALTPHTQCVEQSKSSDDGFVMDKSDDRVYLGTSIVDKYI